MNDFQASDELVAHVKFSEGLVLVPAPDPVGFITWGYGHKARPGEHVPPSITEEQADLLLAADLAIAGTAVRRLVQVEMTQGQYDALTDFTFNLGEGRFATSTMLSDINAGLPWSAAASECKRWIHDHAGHVVPGLVVRRAWDADRLDPEVAAKAWAAEDIVDNTAPVIFQPGDGPVVAGAPAAPAPTIESGGGGDFAGAGASGDFAPVADGAANIPTLTEEHVEQPTPQQIEAAAAPVESPAPAPEPAAETSAAAPAEAPAVP